MRFPVFLFVLAMLNSFCVSALEVGLADSYAREETVILPIRGNIAQSLVPGQFEIKRINVVVPVAFDLKKLNGQYYLLFTAPKSEGNYTLVLKNVEIVQQGTAIKTDYQNNFSVRNELVSYQVKPGFILPARSFTLDITSYEDSEISININFPVVKTLILEPGNNRFSFAISNSKNIRSINVGRYNLPIDFLDSLTRINSLNPQSPLKFSPAKLQGTLEEGVNKKYEIVLSNEGDKDIANISLLFSKDKIDISPQTINLAAKSNHTINLSFHDLVQGEFYEEIEAYSPNASASLSLEFSVVSLQTINLANNSNASLYSCAEKAGGRFCRENEACYGNLTNATDGQCCLGVCVQTQKDSLPWAGYVAALLVIAILVFVYLRYKKSKPSNSSPIKEAVEKIDKKK